MSTDPLALANDGYDSCTVVIDVQSGDIHASTSMSLREFLVSVAAILRQLTAQEREMAWQLMRETIERGEQHGA